MLNIYFHVLDEVTQPIYKELRDLRPKEIKLWFNSVDCDRNKIQQRDKRLIDRNVKDDDLFCFLWNIKKTEVVSLYGDGLKHLATWHDTFQENFICIDRLVPPKNRLVLFRDAVHKEDHPKEFIQVPCFNDLGKLIDYLKNLGFFQFSLENSKRFTKTSFVIQGVPVYQENSTKYYWYLDNFHQTHYEVFDSNGKRHLGEADLDGNLDKSKKDKSKKAIF